MKKKSVREMGAWSRWRHSLSVKSFIGIQITSLLVGIVILIAGFYLYTAGTLNQYYDSTAKMAQAESVMMDSDEIRTKVEEILAIYDSIPEEEKGDGTGQDYHDKFTSVIDKSYRDLQEDLRIMRTEVELRNAFVVAIDQKTNRMIYLVDSDEDEETFCYPGTWDVYSASDISILIHGKKASSLQTLIGQRDRPQATITFTQNYGARCTGGATLYETDDYTIMVCLDEKLDYMIRNSKVFLIEYIALLVIVVIIISFLTMLLIRKVLVKPINKMASAARKYTEDKQNDITAANHFKDLGIESGDEIEELNFTMAEMEDSLTEYVEHLTIATAEKERISTEIGLAARIQADMLPNVFPPFPERKEFDIFASMDPAKDIGGDFYDFFLIDDDHIALIMADVAGKGIPAALFMMVSKIILDNRIMEVDSPATALEHANVVLCKNKEDMFVTVWLGILEISTGKITASNAGHERPVMIHPDGHAELINDKHGFVVGGMEGMKYKDYELQMEPGSKLFLYTDGVPEATSADKGLFGTERMMDALSGTARTQNAGNVIEAEAGDAVQKQDAISGTVQKQDAAGASAGAAAGTSTGAYANAPVGTSADGSAGDSHGAAADNASARASAKDVLINVRAAVDEFVGEDEQFDDLTMLCLEYRGPEGI